MKTFFVSLGLSLLLLGYFDLVSILKLNRSNEDTLVVIVLLYWVLLVTAIIISMVIAKHFRKPAPGNTATKIFLIGLGLSLPTILALVLLAAAFEGATTDFGPGASLFLLALNAGVITLAMILAQNFRDHVPALAAPLTVTQNVNVSNPGDYFYTQRGWEVDRGPLAPDPSRRSSPRLGTPTAPGLPPQMNPGAGGPRIRILAPNALTFAGDYALLLEGVRAVAMESKGTVTVDRPDEGIIEVKFTSLVSWSFALTVLWRLQLTDTEEISVKVEGSIAGIDTLNQGHRRSAEQMERLVQLMADKHEAIVELASGAQTAVPIAAAQKVMPPAQRGVGEARHNFSTMAAWAMICGILGLITFGPFPGLLGIVFGAVARSNMHKHNSFAGNGMATAGLTMGIISTIAGGLLGWLIFLGTR